MLALGIFMSITSLTAETLIAATLRGDIKKTMTPDEMLVALHVAAAAFPWDHNARRLPVVVAVNLSSTTPPHLILAEVEQAMATDPYARDLKAQRSELVKFLVGAK